MKKTIFTSIAAAALVLAACTAKPQLTVSGLNPADFNGTYNGAPVALYTLTNSNGMEVCITNFGGRIVSIAVPDRDGTMRDVVLGFDNIQDYFPENNDSNFGAVIGRYGNRINQGRITIDGETYQLPQNNYGHCLHGGPDGWHYRVFNVEEADASHLKLSLTSPSGDAGFPGEVKAFVTYTLGDDNGLSLEYEATTDAPTVINLTNHSYFNLSGDPAGHAITDDELMIAASGFTPIDSTFMTSGEIAPVEGTPFDFRKPKLIGADIEADDEQLRNGHGYDHNWVLDTGCCGGCETGRSSACADAGCCGGCETGRSSACADAACCGGCETGRGSACADAGCCGGCETGRSSACADAGCCGGCTTECDEAKKDDACAQRVGCDTAGADAACDKAGCCGGTAGIDKVAAELYCPATGIAMTVRTCEPGLQVYVGNFLNGSVTGKKGVPYEFRHAICMETQHFPDSPNKPQWPSVVLRPGETYHSQCIYTFSIR